VTDQDHLDHLERRRAGMWPGTYIKSGPFVLDPHKIFTGSKTPVEGREGVYRLAAEKPAPVTRNGITVRQL
jgi:hypothetical protein